MIIYCSCLEMYHLEKKHVKFEKKCPLFLWISCVHSSHVLFFQIEDKPEDLTLEMVASKYWRYKTMKIESTVIYLNPSSKNYQLFPTSHCDRKLTHFLKVSIFSLKSDINCTGTLLIFPFSESIQEFWYSFVFAFAMNE